MDNVIFELRFLRKMLSTPTTDNRIDLFSADIDTDLCGMDINMYSRKRDRLREFMRRWRRSSFLVDCNVTVTRLLFRDNQRDDYQYITDEQITFLLEMMNFLLVQHTSRDLENPPLFCLCITLLVKLSVVLLESNKKAECVVWIREHLSELTSLTTNESKSILHVLCGVFVGCFPKEAMVRLIVENGKMDVNVENIRRQTPLHVLSVDASWYMPDKPNEDTMRVVELLINNGAHMDSMDVNGLEASWFFSQRFPQFSFNFNLKCLAARAIIKHSIRYEKIVGLPADLVKCIDSHKPGSL